jgi:exosortase family protein XrtF
VPRDPLYRFFLIVGSSFVAWYLFYEFALHPWGKLDLWLIDDLKQKSEWVLTSLGYTLLPESENAEQMRFVGIDGGSYLWIGDPCNGLNLFAVFTIFILAFPGRSQAKWWFVPAGILVIHIINALRIAVLSILASINYELFNFQHDYTFYVIVYGIVFLMWHIWVKYFSKR